MAIAPGGTFDYEISIEEYKGSPKPTWIGKARTIRDRAIHPGLLGYAPDFELSKGLVTLRSTDPEHFRRKDKHFIRQRPLALASFEIGDALAMAVGDQDILRFRRSGTGDLGLSLIRREKLILAIGAIAGIPLGSEIRVQEDELLRECQGFRALSEPPLRPLHVKVIILNQALDLLEGEEATVNSYYIFVERTYKIGIPGQQSILSMVRLDESATKEEIIRCTKRFSEPNKMI